jgi:hypothetical protein
MGREDKNDFKNLIGLDGKSPSYKILWGLNGLKQTNKQTNPKQTSLGFGNRIGNRPVYENNSYKPLNQCL